MASPRGKTRRIAWWALGIFSGLSLLAVAILLGGGWWVQHRYLRHEIRLGENGTTRIRAYGAKLRWTLGFDLDSLWFRSPGADVRLGKTSANVDLLRGFTAFRPAARLKADSVYLRLRADTTTPKKPLDSIAFPDFKIPLAVSVRVRALRVDDDSGLLARARDLRADNRGGRAATAQIGWLASRWTSTLPIAARARADWSVKDSVDVSAQVTRDSDRVALSGRHAKAPLWHGRDSVDVRARDSRPYARAFGLDSLPDVRNLQLQAGARLSESPALNARLRGEAAAHRVSKDFVLSPQSVDLSVRIKDGAGSLRLQSRGRDGENLSLQGEGRRLKGISDSAQWWEKIAFSLSGKAENFRVRVKDTVRSADVTLEKAAWTGRDLSVALATGDSSRVRAQARRKPNGDWSGTFAVNVSPGERWVRAFTADNVSFASLSARGSVDGKTVAAEVAASKLFAYGARLDSLRTFHAYGPEGYTLKPSVLYAGTTAWTVSGKAAPARKPGQAAALSLTLESKDHGSLSVSQLPDHTLEVRASKFQAGALPYAKLDSLPLREPVLDGSFKWNPERKTGATDLAAWGRYRGEDLEAHAIGKWDARELQVDLASIGFKTSSLNLRARVRLDGRQFYRAAFLKPSKYKFLALETPGLDLAGALKIFQPDPALTHGSVKGGLSYNGDEGFAGTLVFDGLVPRDAPGDVVLKKLEIEGLGDTLRVEARTASASNPLFNDSLRLSVAHVLADTQRVRLDVVAGDSLRLHFDAAARQFQALRGSIEIAGRAPLPEKSGSIDSLKALLDFDVPLTDPARNATLTTRSFQGIYVLPGLTRQRFSLDPALQNGVLRIDHLTVRNEQGQSLTGHLDYTLAKGALRAHVEGSRFAAQWTPDYRADLRGFSLDFANDSGGMSVSGDISEAALLYANAPLYAKGTLTDVSLGYTLPPALKARGRLQQEPPAVLRLSATLSQSLLRYRLKSFADLQKLFRKDARKRRTSAGPPLQLNVRVQTAGDSNVIDSDLLRLRWVGNLNIRGTSPYTLFNGRMNALDGGFGLENQAYGIQQLEVKWLNAPVEEGVVHLEAKKNLASTCRPASSSNDVTDSCAVITRLDGKLSAMQFTYDSDCGGAFGAGASVAAILYSVERGCYDASLATGQGGGYGEKALTLLEPTINRSLSKVIGRYSGSWIEATEVSGLGSLSADDPHQGDSLGEALSLGVTSKEFLRLRLRARSGYHTASQDLSNPWEHMLAVEWRPPLAEYINDPDWRRRLMDNLRLVASVQTLPVRRDTPAEDEVQKQIGLNYAYSFWGSWWDKPRSIKRAPPRDTTTAGASK